MHVALKQIYLIGVRDVNDLSNVQSSTWKLSNAFNPQTSSRSGHHWVMGEEEGAVSLGTNLNTV